MGLFKRKINKNAQNIPHIARDFSSSVNTIFNTDGTTFACIDKIASEIAGLNYHVFSTKSKQKTNHDILKLIKQPNLEDFHFNFFYQSVVDYFNGGVFWLKSVVNDEVVSLFRLDPSQITKRRNEHTNEKEYLYNGKVYTAKDLIYIPSRFSYSTLRGGQSIFDTVANVFNTSRELEKFTQSSFSNGGIGKRLVIDVQGAFPNITDEQASEIRNAFASAYGGSQNAGKPILKKKGFEYSELGTTVDNRSAELTENRRFQEHEISKIFGVPESLLTVTEKTNLENTFVMFNEFAIKPIATQIEEAINSLLDENRFYFEFDYNGLMKVNFNQRIEAYTKQINNGLLSPNEARAKENLSSIEAGDNHFMPVNLMPLNDETINAYMAKQKNEINNSNPTDENAQHFGGGDDKQ